MTMLRRYTLAFWKALQMTIRGEKIDTPAQSPLTTWINQYRLLVDNVLRAANQNGVDQAMRKQVKLRLDGRPMSFETALMTLRFHATEEYPSLIRQGTGRGVQNTLYATNMNDRYWLSIMQQAPELQKPDLQQAFSKLDSHLDAIPRLD